ncbi:iron-sulfur cluster assembly protein [Thermococcus thioreducens]|uniref:MIP18 family-like domain-containing protein n=1 Tax=Thermococcus thioreducens TaxID=277988 RepID=A0A0Q2RDL3_9EURY|nr:iron-sulfur cluster assembly protein [Thermococcus thioreducens]ASJ12707.1 hypothetical protein A3L14_07325 [Thermococcus thioreducens]KQH82038.1 hypothetical protein AMR53_08100 [Thermococcus thioreducens]SEV86423.1 protein of unknown function DUF59 [Thermococcus thioreducens]
MGLFELFRTKKKPKKGPKRDLPAEVSRVVQILRNVHDPETGLNIVDEGLLYGLTVEGENVDVFLLIARSTPECHFCQMLAINVQERILNDIIQILKEEGFNRIRVYNELGLLLEEG